MRRLGKVFLALAVTVLASPAHATQGVSDTEIVIGSNTDLSGPFAAFAVGSVKSIQQALEEANAKGGIHGRKIRFIVEDHAYQIPKATQNFNKLINSDRVFAMIMNLGTPMNVAGRPLMEAKKVANVVPLTLARQMLEGDISFMYSGFSSYYEEIRAGVGHLAKQGGVSKLCSIYIPSYFGLETAAAVKDKAKELNLTVAAESTHKADEQDFTGAITKLREAGCDVVATALAPPQAILAYSTAKRLGWTDVRFIGPSASYNTAIAKVPGGATDGYYAAAGWSDFENRRDQPAIKKWVESFEAYSGEKAGTSAQLGKIAVTTLLRALEAAGRSLTAETFRSAMESLDYKDEIADVQIKYGPGDHRGSDTVVISRIEGGKWVEIQRTAAGAAR